MTVVLAVELAVLCVIGLFVWWWQSSHGLLAQRLRRRVVVTLKSGETFVGVLYAADRDVVVLRDAQPVGEPGATVTVDGELLVQRADVAYLQVP